MSTFALPAAQQNLEADARYAGITAGYLTPPLHTPLLGLRDVYQSIAEGVGTSIKVGKAVD